MNNLILKIEDEFADDSDLSTALSNGLWFTEAPEGTKPPYGVFFIISNSPVYTLAGIKEQYKVQFNIFSNARGAQEIAHNFTKLKAVYDQLAFDYLTLGDEEDLGDGALLNEKHYEFIREFDGLLRPDGMVWQWTVQYRVEVYFS